MRQETPDEENNEYRALERTDEGNEEFDMRCLSLGAGVQSSAMILMADRGDFGDVPEHAIFADTQSEPPWVYEHLSWLESEIKHIKIHRVTAGSLENDVLKSRDGRSRFASLPLRVQGSDGRDSMLRRQCTREYKIAPIEKKVRELLGLKPRQRAKGKFKVEQWIGISLDEVQRMKPNPNTWITNRWPLVFDKPMRRGEIIDWFTRENFPVPQKSACTFCPFHDDRTWDDMRKNPPSEWSRAVTFDKAIRTGKLRGVNEEAFLHRSLKPLDEVEFNVDDPNQIDMFGNECERMCGV